MPKLNELLTTGEYVTVYRDTRQNIIYPAKKGLIVAVSPRYVKVQMSPDEIWRVTHEQLIKCVGENGPAENFLIDLAKFLEENYEIDENVTFTKEWLKEKLDLINKNKLVRDAYISDKGNLIVLTRSLIAFDWDGSKTSTRVGRFLITFRFDYGQPIMIRNLDWIRDSYEHPHVDGFSGLCEGDAETPIYDSWQRGDIHSIIEIIIALLGQFDMTDSEYTDWLGYRNARRGKSLDFIETKAKIKWN